MARVQVRLPMGMTIGDGRRDVDCIAATVGEALGDLVALEPRLKSRIFGNDGRIWTGVFLNRRHVNTLEGLDTPLEDGDTIRILPPICGG